MNLEKWKKSPDDLDKAVGYVSPKTGEYVVFKANDKRIIVHLLNRVGFFVDKLKGEYYESQETIATALGLSYKNFGISARKMIENGLIDAELRKPDKGKTRWFYDGVNTGVVLWVGSKDNPILLDKEGNPITKPQTSAKISKKTVVEKKQTLTEERDPDLPEWA